MRIVGATGHEVGLHGRRHELDDPHARAGELQVDCQVLFTEDRGQALLVLTAAPRSDDEEKIRLLRVVGAQRF